MKIIGITASILLAVLLFGVLWVSPEAPSEHLVGLRIVLGIGALISGVRELVIICSEHLFSKAHNNLPRFELQLRIVWLLAVSFFAILTTGLIDIPSRITLASSVVVMLIVSVDTSKVISGLLRSRISRALATGRAEDAKQFASRLFDLMCVQKFADKKGVTAPDFAKSAYILAALRESLGDYRLAKMLYAWALESFASMAKKKGGNLSSRNLSRMIEAACGKFRVTTFFSPYEAAKSLKLVETLCNVQKTPDSAARCLSVGGRVTGIDSSGKSARGDSLAESILRKNAFSVFQYDAFPNFNEIYSAFVLAKLYKERGDIENSLDVISNVCRRLHKKFDVREFFLWLQCEELRGDLVEENGNYDKAIAIFLDMSEAIEARLNQLAQAGNESELLALSDIGAQVLTRVVGLVAQRFPDQDKIVKRSFEAALRLKGIAFWVRINLARALTTGLQDQFQKQAAEIVILRGRLASIWSNTEYSTMNFEFDRLELERLEVFLREKRLGSDWLNFISEVNEGSIKVCLNSGERLFEFVKAKFSKNEERYVAFTVSGKPADSVRLLVLGEASEVDAGILEWRSLIQLGANPSRKNQAVASIQAKLVDLLDSSIDDAASLILSTDGNLGLLPFETFYSPSGKRFIESYEILYISSSKELLLRRSTPPAYASRPVVIAAPDFDLCDEVAGESFDVKSEQSKATIRKEFEPLTFAAHEGESVAKLIGADLFTGKNATVGRIKTVKSPRVLHVATHAFAFEAVPPRSALAPDSSSERWDRLRFADDAFVRSGLAMAGVNAVARGRRAPLDCESGILTALEASVLDLQGTELVVLSACETARGQLHKGDGILGLRRAFSIAGAHALITTLWRVPDAQTCDFMICLYRGVVGGMTIQEALRSAKLEMMQRHPQPLYWAAFVYYGSVGLRPH